MADDVRRRDGAERCRFCTSDMAVDGLPGNEKSVERLYAEDVARADGSHTEVAVFVDLDNKRITGGMVHHVDGGQLAANWAFRIRFCPMCGKELNDGKD
ncbi:MAG: hypothetical protein IJ087_09875 [Eggerthellaceae bacterium]|nr:hypothetical protein [Eggerthellaceae bacterium]